MPAVMPALGATGPSATKMRLAWTRAAGCKRASCPIRLWWVVHWRPSSRPARAASSAPEHTVHSRAEPDASAGPTLRASHAAVSHSHRSRSALGPPAWSATPTTTTQAPCGKRFGNGAMPLSAIGSELGSDLRAPATDSAKAGTAPARPDKRFAIRKGSATPARSSNSTPGVTTTITVVVVGRDGAGSGRFGMRHGAGPMLVGPRQRALDRHDPREAPFQHQFRALLDLGARVLAPVG